MILCDFEGEFCTKQEKSSRDLLLFGSSLLGGLLGSLLSGLFSSRLLSCFPCWLLSSGLLGSLRFLGFLGLGLLGLLDLLWLGNLDNPVLASSLARRSDSLESPLSHSPLEDQAHLDSSLGSINLVVGADVLEDGLAGRSSALLQGTDGSGDHDGVLGVGRRLANLLDLRSSSRHDECVVWAPC